MALQTIQLGKILITHKGAWSNAVDYEALDVVSYRGSSYLAILDPPTGTVTTNTTYWRPLSKSAYEYAIEQGYEGTEEEFGVLIDSISDRELSSNKVTSLSSESTDIQYPSAKVTYEELANKIDKSSITSELGNSEELVMSQKAVTDELSALEQNIGNLEGGQIINIKPQMISGYYLQIDGVKLDDTYWGYTPILELYKGDVVYIKSAQNAQLNHVLIAQYFTDDETNFQGINHLMPNGGGGYQEYNYTIPNDGYYRISMSSYYFDSLATITRAVHNNIVTNSDNIDAIRDSLSLAPYKLKPSASNVLPSMAFNIDISGSNYSITKCLEVLPIFESYGIRCGIALKSHINTITQFGALYRDWQKRGFNIINHALGTEVYNSSMPYATGVAQILESDKNLSEAGIISNSWCSPNSTIDASFIPILKNLYAYGFTISDGNNNSRETDPMKILRQGCESLTLQAIEDYIDGYVAADRIIYLYFHPDNLGLTFNGEIFDENKLRSIIEYCIAKRDNNECLLLNSDDAAKSFFNL